MCVTLVFIRKQQVADAIVHGCLFFFGNQRVNRLLNAIMYEKKYRTLFVIQLFHHLIVIRLWYHISVKYGFLQGPAGFNHSIPVNGSKGFQIETASNTGSECKHLLRLWGQLLYFFSKQFYHIVCNIFSSDL